MNVVKPSLFTYNKTCNRSWISRKLYRQMCSVAEEIQIPARIERTSTDILKAIASTVGTDFTAPHYRYHDDPWLIPYTLNEKRDFLLAKEAGKNAARFILENHPNLFTKNRVTAEPPVNAYLPRVKYNKDNVTVELLENMVKHFQVADAADVYELLVSKKKDIPEDLVLSLLELLAFHSEDEPLTPENIESRKMLPDVKAWNAGGLAEKMYSAMKSPEARLAMLLGFARHNQPIRTLQVWGEIETNNDKVPIEGFNALLSAINIEDATKLKAEITKTLTRLRDLGIQPNAETLVCCLHAVSRTASKHKGNYTGCCELGLSIMAEFKEIGVEPSLGAFYQLLEIYYTKASRERPLIIKDILDFLDGKDMWPAQSLQDFDFFLRAVEVAGLLNSNKIAYRIHNLVLTGNNINLLGNLRKSERYYEIFMMLLLRTEDLDTTLQMYNKLAPHTWSPRKDFFNNLLVEINSKAAVQYLGKIYDDIELCSHGGASKEEMYEMNTMVLVCMNSHPPASSQFTNLSQTYVDIAQRIFKHLEMNKASAGLYLRFNTHAAKICSLAIQVLLKEAQFTSACSILTFCNEEKERMPGQLSESSLTSLMEAAVEAENTDVGIQIVDYLVGMNSGEARPCAQMLATLPLQSREKNTLNKLLSFDQKWVNI